MDSDFFEQLKPWSRRKHRLLGKYLPPFSAKVAKASANREIFCVDGFAGAARYEDGSEGSPLLIAKFSDQCSGWSNPVNLKLINVEPDNQKDGAFESLENATASWTARDTVKNINKSFRDATPEILQKIANAPTLFFLDPFGPTYVHFSDILPILTRSQKITELIINFDQDGLRRVLDAALSTRSDPKTASTNIQMISKVLGNENWRQKIDRAKLTSREAEEILVREYMANISKYGYEVVAYPIRESLKSKPKYYFVYCTRHADGIGLMNDFIREEEDSLYDEHVDINLPLFLEEASLTNAVNERRERLKLIVLDSLQERVPFTRGGVRTQVIASNFGNFHRNDYTAVFQELLREGSIKEQSGKMRINDDSILEVKQ